MKHTLGKERFMLHSNTVDEPYHVRLGIVNGFENVKRWNDIKIKILYETWLERWYAASDVIKIDVHLGKLHGILFSPAGGIKRPGIIELDGIRAFVAGHKGALLASYGYTCLSVCYADQEKLPHFVPIDLDYFDDAVKFMLTHPLVDAKQGLAVIGLSMGAEIALHMTSYNPQIKVCVSINGQSTYLWVASKARYKGKDIRAEPSFNDAIISQEGIITRKLHSRIDLADRIPVERSQAKFLLIHGCDDQTYHYSHALYLANRIRMFGNGKCVVKLYPGAGHILYPPYTPLCLSAYNPFLGCPIVFGGDVRQHAVAQQNSWQCILNVLNQNFENNYTRIGRKNSSRHNFGSKI